MTAEERAYNYASTQKPTKLQVGEIAKHYNNGYQQSIKDFLEKAERYLKYTLYDRVEIEVFGTVIPSIVNKKEFIDNFKNYMKDESEN